MSCFRVQFLANIEAEDELFGRGLSIRKGVTFRKHIHWRRCTEEYQTRFQSSETVFDTTSQTLIGRGGQKPQCFAWEEEATPRRV